MRCEGHVLPWPGRQDLGEMPDPGLCRGDVHQVQMPLRPIIVLVVGGRLDQVAAQEGEDEAVRVPEAEAAPEGVVSRDAAAQRTRVAGSEHAAMSSTMSSGSQDLIFIVWGCCCRPLACICELMASSSPPPPPPPPPFFTRRSGSMWLVLLSDRVLWYNEPKYIITQERGRRSRKRTN